MAISKKRKFFSKPTLFIGLISGLFFWLTTVYNACAPLESAYLSSLDKDGGFGGVGGNSNPLGETYFKTTITEIFKNRVQQCISCHGDPRERDPSQPAGPNLASSYSRLRKLLVGGTSATNNGVYNKITNSNGSHPGGNRCLLGPSATPCKEFIKWYELETSSATSIPGQITSITGVGDIQGWAADASNTSRTVMVKIYEGGPSSSGTLVGTISADQSGSSGGFAGNHAFYFQLPVNLRDGTLRDIYAYGIDSSGKEIELSNSPFSAATYNPSTASRNDFNANVAPIMRNNCGGCHGQNGFSFDDAFFRLLTPTPAGGGTETNNRLYTYGTGGNNHGGGNACGGGCQALRNWYRVTFP